MRILWLLDGCSDDRQQHDRPFVLYFRLLRSDSAKMALIISSPNSSYTVTHDSSTLSFHPFSCNNSFKVEIMAFPMKGIYDALTPYCVCRFPNCPRISVKLSISGPNKAKTESSMFTIRLAWMRMPMRCSADLRILLASSLAAGGNPNTMRVRGSISKSLNGSETEKRTRPMSEVSTIVHDWQEALWRFVQKRLSFPPDWACRTFLKSPELWYLQSQDAAWPVPMFPPHRQWSRKGVLAPWCCYSSSCVSLEEEVELMELLRWNFLLRGERILWTCGTVWTTQPLLWCAFGSPALVFGVRTHGFYKSAELLGMTVTVNKSDKAKPQKGQTNTLCVIVRSIDFLLCFSLFFCVSIRNLTKKSIIDKIKYLSEQPRQKILLRSYAWWQLTLWSDVIINWIHFLRPQTLCLPRTVFQAFWEFAGSTLCDFFYAPIVITNSFK